MLTDHEIGLLYEIYEISFRAKTVVTSPGGQVTFSESTIFSIQNALSEAITLINANTAHCERVQVILQEFEELSLDPSNIDQEGYQLRPARNIKTIRTRLYPYTGILVNSPNQSGRLLIG